MDESNTIAPSPDNPTTDIQNIASLISDLDRRLRVLEERYSNLRKKIQLTDENLVDGERTFSREIKSFNDSLIELKRSTIDFSDKITIFESELSRTAKKSDVKIIEKYLALWTPIMFVTRKELKDYLETKKMFKDTPKDEETF